MRDVAEYLIEAGSTLSEALTRIEGADEKLLFVTDKGVLVGSLTDGDVRRALLAGLLSSNSVDVAMNRNVVTSDISESADQQSQKFIRGVSAIPIVDAQGRVLDVCHRPSSALFPISRPSLTDLELDMITDCVRSGWISSVGPNVNKFEDEFGNFVGADHCVAVANGTLAIVLALHALGIGPGDEVFVPDLTFGATANAVIQVGAVPRLIDIDVETWGLDPDGITVGPKTRAIIAVHLYGREAQIEKLRRFASEHDLVLIEDCAEALGTRSVEGRHVGTFGDAATFSFFANKVMTTGEGGMVCFQDKGVAKVAREIRSHGLSSTDRFTHAIWGSNFRMTSIQASLGLGQLQRLEFMLGRREKLAHAYTKELCSVVGDMVEVPRVQTDSWNRSVWLFSLLLPADLDRDRIIQQMGSVGIESRPFFKPLHRQPAFASYARPASLYPNAEDIASRGLSLPTYPDMSPSDAQEIAQKLANVIRAQVTGD